MIILVGATFPPSQCGTGRTTRLPSFHFIARLGSNDPDNPIISLQPDLQPRLQSSHHFDLLYHYYSLNPGSFSKFVKFSIP
jgi:hypothetical protein